MAHKNVHPAYADQLDKWELCLDSFEGEQAVKDRGTTYLPATSGQVTDGAGTAGTTGEQAYQAMKTRAVYPEIFKEAVEAAVGIMHRYPPTIELPEAMETLMEKASPIGESLPMLMRKVNAYQLVSGRLGILGDIRVNKADNSARPVLVLYKEKSILNWDDISEDGEDGEILFVELDESGHERDENLKWSYKEKRRIIAKIVNTEGEEGEAGWELSKDGSYQTAVLDAKLDFSAAIFSEPQVRGQGAEAIPFAFVNSQDTAPTPGSPPLLGLANQCMTIYRGEGDYRQNLFMQGQDTLVVIGGNTDEDDDVRTGAGARIDLPLNGDAKFIGVSANGLSEQREALENDYERALQKAGQLLSKSSNAESGEALKLRVAAQTATLPAIAQTGAAAVQQVLRDLAKWLGHDPEKVVVKPNLRFTEADLNGQTLVQILQAKGLGAPISDESIHEWMQEQGFTKKSFEDETGLLDNEEPAGDVNLGDGNTDDGNDGDE